jgi:hypothetical protein
MTGRSPSGSARLSLRVDTLNQEVWLGHTPFTRLAVLPTGPTNPRCQSRKSLHSAVIVNFVSSDHAPPEGRDRTGWDLLFP